MKSILYKTTLVVTLFLGVHYNSNAQLALGILQNNVFPTGDFNDFSGYGIGANFSAKYFLSEKVALAADIGANRIFLKHKVGDHKFSLFPMTVGFNYFFSEGDFRPFIGANLGAFFNHSEIVLNSLNNIKVIENHTYFGFGPEFGFLYGISDKIDLSANVRYIWQVVPSDGNYLADKSTVYPFVGLNVGVYYTIGGK